MLVVHRFSGLEPTPVPYVTRPYHNEFVMCLHELRLESDHRVKWPTVRVS